MSAETELDKALTAVNAWRAKHGLSSVTWADDKAAAARHRELQLLGIETRAAGEDTHPGGEQLHHYWTRGAGLAKWRTSPHPWTTLYTLLLEHMKPAMAKRAASKWFIEVFGYAAGSDLHRVGSGKPPRGKRIGPG